MQAHGFLLRAMTTRCCTRCALLVCSLVLGGLGVVGVKTLVEELPSFFGEQVDDGVIERIDDEAIGYRESFSEWLQ